MEHTHNNTTSCVRREAPHAPRPVPHARGFTLVETLIAITVLLVSVGGPLTLAQQGLSAAFVARDEVAGFYLAQEAIEFVRKVRDSNGIDRINGGGASWLDGLSGCIGGGACRIDVFNNTATACSGACPPLMYNTMTHTYNYDGLAPNNIQSIFTREVRISDAGNPSCTDCEAIVEVTVTWKTRNIAKTTTVVDHLYNWQQ